VKRSTGEEHFLDAWGIYHKTTWPLEEEYRFDKVRLWRFDFAIPDLMIAIEIEGVSYQKQGRHQTATGFTKDCEKYNSATCDGWAVLRYTPPQIVKSPLQVVTQIEAFIERRDTELRLAKQKCDRHRRTRKSTDRNRE